MQEPGIEGFVMVDQTERPVFEAHSEPTDPASPLNSFADPAVKDRDLFPAAAQPETARCLLPSAASVAFDPYGLVVPFHFRGPYQKGGRRHAGRVDQTS